MKNILLILLICFTFYSCGAQIYPMERDYAVLSEPGVYFKDINNNLDKFVGTWEYVGANFKLTVVLQKIEDYEDSGYYSDVVVGNFIYEENGVEIINTLTNPSATQGSHDIYHIEMFSIQNPSLIKGDFEDPIRSKWTDYTLYLTYDLPFIGNNQPQLEWNIIISEFYNPDDDIDAEQALRVPKQLTLTKI